MCSNKYILYTTVKEEFYGNIEQEFTINYIRLYISHDLVRSSLFTYCPSPSTQRNIAGYYYYSYQQGRRKQFFSGQANQLQSCLDT